MSKFRITTAWCSESGENPWLVSAYDEFTEDVWNGTPEFFNKDIEKVSGEIRIIDLYVDYDAIEECFRSVDVSAEVGADR